jgi:hypothetical protein
MKNFSYDRFPCKSLNIIYGFEMSKSQENPFKREFFEFIGQFYFLNYDFQIQEVFLKYEILENGLGIFQTFLI